MEKTQQTENEVVTVWKSTQQEPNVNRMYKDTVFRRLYQDKGNLLSLYNAINGTNYDNPDDLQINTLENALYLGMRNDVSCIIDMCMGLYEHQSTVNPNMPLRNLFYISRLYQMIIPEKKLYGRTPIQIPTPQFVVFYNGEREQPERCIMRLSNLYAVQEEIPNLELVVVQLNINKGYNEDIKQCCRTLGEYTQFIDRVRKWNKVMELKDAVEKAVDECIHEGILAEFLTENRREVLGMSLTEWNQELFLEASFEDGEKVGRAEGERIGRAEGEKIGRTEGEKIGEARGEKQAKEKLILAMLRKNQSLETISELTDLPLSYIEEVAEKQ